MAYYWERYELGTEAFQSINMCSNPEYRNFSFEELRLKDYDEGRTGQENSSIGYVTANVIIPPDTIILPLSKRVNKNAVSKLGNDILIFDVGKDPSEKFSVHEAIVAPRSEFVRLSLKPHWKEATERVIPLPDDEPAVFSLYQTWLYHSILPSINTDQGISPTSEYQLLVKAYIFGDKIMDVDFKDTVIDAIFDKLHRQQCFDISLTNLVYENTIPGSALRRLWMDIYYFAGSPRWFDEPSDGATINSEFIVDFNRFQMRQRAGFCKTTWTVFTCTYHEHGINRSCCRKKY